MKTRTTLISLLLLTPFLLFAQTEDNSGAEKAPSSFSLAINQDNAFGFYPAIYGSFGLNKNTSLTFYSIFWTNPQYGTAEAGTDLWTEMGIGLGFSLWDDQILLQPSIGFTHGRLLSGQPEGVAGDGIVPSLVAFYFGQRLELEAFFSYYRSMRRDQVSFTDYVLYWAYPGVIINEHISLGLHFESFDLTSAGFDIEPGPLYTWFGAYVKFTVKGKYALRFSTGSNSANESTYSDDFYKITALIPFE